MAGFSLNPGEMRTRITLQAPTISQDAGGAQSVVYANVPTNPTVWAKWVNDHGQEHTASGAAVSAQQATVTIRYRSDASETWRVSRGSETWRVVSVDHVQGRNRWTALRVERVKGTV